MRHLKNKIKILFVYRSLLSFVKGDLEILRRHFEVFPVQWRGKRDIPRIAQGVLKSDLTFSWFASDHAAVTVFFSKLFRKKSIVVVGGYDAAYVPEINYGAFTNIKGKIPAKYIYKNATKILVVDPSLKADIIKNAKLNGFNIDYLPTGYDPNYWKPGNKKEKIVLTVGIIRDTVV